VQVNEGGHSRWVSRQETWTEVREQVFDRHQCVTCDNEYEKSHYRTRKENVCTER
jgi:hypothetical protein